MNPFEVLLPGPRAILLLANIALVVIVVSAVGLLTVQLYRRRSAPARYAILLCTLALVTAAPVVVVIAEAASVGWVRVAFHSHEVADAPAMSNSSIAGERSPLPDSVDMEEREAAPSREPPPRAIASPRVSWVLAAAAVLACIWFAGSLVNGLLLLRSLVGLIRFRQGLRERASPPAVGATLRLASRVGLVRPPRLFVSARIASPVAIGLYSPVIVLPRGFQEEVGAEQLDDVLLHELAHIARRDHWVGLAQRFAKVLYWWCPLIYAVHRQLRVLREEICDNYVLRHQGDGTRFAKLLLALADRASSMPALPASTGLFDTTGGLEQRVQRLLSNETDAVVRTHAGVKFVLGLSFVAVAFVAAIFTVRADDHIDGVADTPTENLHTLPENPKAVVLSLDYRGARDVLTPRRENGEPHLQILADGTAVAGASGNVKRVTKKLTLQQVQSLLQFVVDEQRFRGIKDKDLGLPAGSFGSGGQSAVVSVDCNGQRHEVRFVAGIDVRRAATEGEDSPAGRILAIRERLEQVRGAMYAGGEAGIAEHLRKVNARLRAEHKDVPPLTAGDLQGAAAFTNGGSNVIFEREEELAGGGTRFTRATIQHRPRSEPTIFIAVRVDGQEQR